MELSVIVPTRNRAASLEALLASIAKVERPPFDWEVLVLDNDSTDETRMVVDAYKSRVPVSLRYIRTERPGLHVGRNTGAREARGECLAYLDDDTLVSCSWWRGAMPVLEHRVGAVAGRIVPKWECEPPVWLGTYYQAGVCGALTLLDLGNAEVSVAPASYVWGANFFVERKTVLELDGFHPDAMPSALLRYRGDGETGFFKKFASKGRIACYSPDATVQHVIASDRLTVEYLCRRRFRQGVSDSYTTIRETGKAPATRGVSWRERLRALLRCPRTTFGPWQVGAEEVHSMVQLLPSHVEVHAKSAYKAGYEFHQYEVGNDPALLEWVLRKEYW